MFPSITVEVAMTLAEFLMLFTSQGMSSFNLNENMKKISNSFEEKGFLLKICVAMPVKSLLCVSARNESQAKCPISLCKLIISFQPNRACVCH